MWVIKTLHTLKEMCSTTFIICVNNKNFLNEWSFAAVYFRYAMKCLDKKRIKMKGGETLALNERIMLSLVSTGVSVIANKN